MRSLVRLTVGAALLALPASVLAQPVVGVVKDLNTCATPGGNYTIYPNGGELYAVKFGSAAPFSANDWVADLDTKTAGSRIGVNAGDISNHIWQVVTDNFTVAPAPSHTVFTLITFPDGTLYLDSGDLSTTTFGANRRQAVGNAPPGGEFASSGLVLPDAAGTYAIPSANIQQQPGVGAPAADFPLGTNTGIEVPFAPFVEINNDTLSDGCRIGGRLPDPGQTGGRGIIIGYNVYRMQDTGTQPTVAQLGTVANWQYFADISGFNLSVTDTGGTAGPDTDGDTLPEGMGDDAPSDSNPDGDLVGFQNQDGIAYTGDEVVVFSDSGTLPNAMPRPTGTGPVVTGTPPPAYWYAFQPVVRGDMAQWNNIVLAGLPRGDLRRDADGDTMFDSIDLDPANANGPEFFSPQAEASLPGLGLTNDGLPLLSGMTRGQANPAAAMGRVGLTATAQGSDVNLSLTNALEAANVLGYNVYRVAGDTRTRINDQVILAQGGSGNVYTLVDAAARPATTRRAGTSGGQYMVEVVYNDGTASGWFGPFDVSADRGATRRR